MKITGSRIENTHTTDPAWVRIVVVGEEPEQEVARRPYRPWRAWQQIVMDELLDDGMIPATMQWSPGACSCGCTQGFRLGGITGLVITMQLDPEGSLPYLDDHRWDVQRRLADYQQLKAAGHA